MAVVIGAALRSGTIPKSDSRSASPKSARKKGSGDAGAIFWVQFRACVTFRKYYVDPGTVPYAEGRFLWRGRGEGYTLGTAKGKIRPSSGRTCAGCEGEWF